MNTALSAALRTARQIVRTEGCSFAVACRGDDVAAMERAEEALTRRILEAILETSGGRKALAAADREGPR